MYKSKKDWWLAVILWGALLYVMGNGLYSLVTERMGMGEFLSVLFLSLVIPVFILWLWLTVAYIIEEEELIVKYGPFKRRIPLYSIKTLKKTMNPISSPALSLKRIELVYGQYSTILTSPKDRDEFMQTIKERCPHVRILK
ncbi:PH domain-containing protein [Halobacillus sp. Marseille-Q1614]|uniref:PH domain-containing protein n=1 Tax=Halobacillus sp. Marseille-Q1614 TaxID=2709134 RepID=UPI00156FD3A3|nr:PH domain-containing protein [Halobacillus sp. Marseille-Q1614]